MGGKGRRRKPSRPELSLGTDSLSLIPIPIIAASVAHLVVPGEDMGRIAPLLLFPSLPSQIRLGGEHTSIHSYETVFLTREIIQDNTWKIFLLEGVCFSWEKWNDCSMLVVSTGRTVISPGRNVRAVCDLNQNYY